MSNNNKERDIANTSWTNLQSSYIDSSVSNAEVRGVFIHNDMYNGPMYQQQNNLQTERYTVLPVGHGNFLKVYHTESEAQPFNNYELFSNNSFISANAVKTAQGNINYDKNNYDNNENPTNMIINQLVTNWTPNLSGTYSPFGEQPATNHFSTNIPLNENTQNINQPTANSSKNQFSSTKTNGSFENNSGQNVEVKKRIIAEVKPMRMSYSDVLSRNVTTNKANVTNGNIPTAMNVASEPSIQVRNKNSSEKNKTVVTANEKKSLSQNDDKDKPEVKQRKQETQSVQKNEENSGVQHIIMKEKKKSFADNTKDEVQNHTWKSKKTPVSSVSKSKQKNSQMNAENIKKRSFKQEVEDDDRTNSSKSNDKEGLYNVTKNDYGTEKKSLQYANPKKSKLTNSTVTKASTRFERQTYSKRNQKHQRDIKYDLIAKFFEKWLEYTMKIISWLFYLIYDIIVLGFSMVCDRVHNFYGIVSSYLINFRHDLKNNSGKPNTWIKNLFKKFDNKFKKNSKWAFWRRFYKKKPYEPVADFYKNGRLPQTGDEAMYSLLNCKGKDAYSILGVTADSSQEQIRKHYKKIAVLVHPDKNKQPGAEEAFKVLQRAFELIGEPENRKKYDQSLAEALNAEKAWTELHDLLSQLQSKIAEAANTIRCSSCGLRHPRKLTERPHYAARECSSCKIRHSAREGDIWAETSIFGLRWKYLALMEGKVYDITEWANCQKGALSQLQPNSHIVQYRIVRGGQQQQQQSTQSDKEKLKKDLPSEPSLDDFLDNLYSGQNPQNQQNLSRKRTKRN